MQTASWPPIVSGLTRPGPSWWQASRAALSSRLRLCLKEGEGEPGGEADPGAQAGAGAGAGAGAEARLGTGQSEWKSPALAGSAKRELMAFSSS